LRDEPITPFSFNYFTNINQSSLLKNGKKSKFSAAIFAFQNERPSSFIQPEPHLRASRDYSCLTRVGLLLNMYSPYPPNPPNPPNFSAAYPIYVA
jgi:hypothetical protein